MPMTGSNRVLEVENLAARFPLENRQTGRRRRLVVAERKRKLNDGNRCFLSLASFCSFPRWPRSRPLRRPSGTTSCTAVTAWVHPHPPLWWTGTIWVSSSGTSARTTGRRSASASASGSRSSARRGEWSLSFSALRSSLGCRERLRIHERRWRKRASMERSAKREGRGRKGSCFFFTRWMEFSFFDLDLGKTLPLNSQQGHLHHRLVAARRRRPGAQDHVQESYQVRGPSWGGCGKRKKRKRGR